MALNAEPLFVALYERMLTLAPTYFQTVSRIHKSSPPMAELQPALYVNGRPRWPIQEINKLTKWVVGASLTIYCRNDPDPDIAPMTQINELIYRVEQALELQPGEQTGLGGSEFQTTLGGLCRSVWISEKEPHGVVLVEGISDGQAMILIPVDMIAAGKG